MRSAGGVAPCPGILVLAAATPTPTASPTTAPTAAPPTARPADGGGPTQTQRQEQSIVFPVAAPIPVPHHHSHGGGGSSLPKTGVDAAEIGGFGTLSLLAGVSLMEFARRRRRHWLAPSPADVATEVVSDHVPAKPAPKPAMVPFVPPTRSEADLMLPYTAARQVATEDFITPTF